ncbi:MAG: translation elongation factor Ts [Proteobacteria bacterium]|nr:translation elongation factor Ts [Pseudomonadota bacterium]
MAEISAKDVKALRDKTGAGMMDCKRALTDAEGHVEKAVDLLRERGLAKAGKRAGRQTSEGAIGVSLKARQAGIVELGCETDFVAKTDDFQTLARTLASLAAEQSSVDSIDKVLAAKLGGETVGDRIAATISKVGENIALKRVARIDVGSGVTGGYVHAGGKLGVIVGLEGDAEGEAAQRLAKDLAMHVAAHDPTPLSIARDGVSAELVEKERKLLRREAEQSGKPANVIEKIINGRLNKFYGENCLLEQAYVKDPDRTVADLVASIDGKARVSGFTRFKLGEESDS